MIVVGVDPGARWTGIVVMNTSAPRLADALLRHITVTNPVKDVLDPSGPYLMNVNACILDALRSTEAELIGVERMNKPTGFSRGRAAALDPQYPMGAAMTVGGVFARSWPVDCIPVPPDSNGSTLPRTQFPEAIRMPEGGKGQDNRRHERSAFEVALRAPAARALLKKLRAAQQRGA